MAVDYRTHPHRRYNPLTEEWVLCSPQRTRRPWQGQVEETPPETRPAYDPHCYLCPGNERAGGVRNPDYTSTFVFDNDFPALLPGSGAEEDHGVDEGGLMVARPTTGRCRVICFSPRHDLSLPLLPVTAIREVVETWAHEVEELGARPEIGYVQIFDNKGEMMGCSNPHPHGQIWATRDLPTIPGRKLTSQRKYFASHGTDLLGDYLALELRLGERLVCANAHWAALVPFWAVWPFETLLVPRRPVGDLPSLLPEERDALAAIIKELTTRYDNLFRVSFPYSMGWHGKPTDGDPHPYWRLHAVYYPPLLRSATVRKFMVGYEMTAEPQRDITPEEAAARLREVPARHYREG
ncbi:MAG: UDP-glucose--hexose-1-phosphate uridylyltransferase [Firmicutes bacterium]|nr:UDP-glucose--hexose-1-phosphate uridylyltransferase [Bacillota bacterium]